MDVGLVSGFKIYRERWKLWLRGPSFENEPEIQDYGHSLIEMIMAKVQTG
jgi:hypothetical protein